MIISISCCPFSAGVSCFAFLYNKKGFFCAGLVSAPAGAAAAGIVIRQPGRQPVRLCDQAATAAGFAWYRHGLNRLPNRRPAPGVIRPEPVTCTRRGIGNLSDVVNYPLNRPKNKKAPYRAMYTNPRKTSQFCEGTGVQNTVCCL